MALYKDLYALRQDSDLLSRIAVACAVAAVNIANEANQPANQAQREKWAVAAISNPAGTAQSMLYVLLAQYNTAQIAVITGADDATLQAAVDGAVDLFANQL